MRRFSTFASAVVWLLAFGAAQPAQAAFPGANGKIAFSKDYNIVTIDPDGTGRTRLTEFYEGDYAPTWSADGSRIAFTRGGSSKIYLMDADGSNLSIFLNLADLPDPYIAFGDVAWSPDGSMLAICAFKSLKFFLPRVFTIASDGTGLSKLSAPGFDECGPAWSPDGTTIAVHATDDHGNGDIVLLAADGSTRETIVSAGSTFAPDWSPSGSQLAYHKGLGCFGGRSSDIFTVNADGSDRTNVTNTPKRCEFSPAWSPDGTLIVYSRGRGPKLFAPGDLWTIAPAGTAPERLTDTPAKSEETPDWQPI